MWRQGDVFAQPWSLNSHGSWSSFAVTARGAGAAARCTVLGTWSSCRMSQEGRRGSCDLALLPALCLNCAARLAGLARSGRASRWGEGRGKAGFWFFCLFFFSPALECESWETN